MGIRTKIWLIRELEKLFKKGEYHDKARIDGYKREVRAQYKKMFHKISHPEIVTFYPDDGESRYDWYLVILPNYIDKSDRLLCTCLGA